MWTLVERSDNKEIVRVLISLIYVKGIEVLETIKEGKSVYRRSEL